MKNLIPYNLFEMSKFEEKEKSKFIEDFIENIEWTIKKYNLNRFGLKIDFSGEGYVYNISDYRERWKDGYDENYSNEEDFLGNIYFYLFYYSKEINYNDVDSFDEFEKNCINIQFGMRLINFFIYNWNESESKTLSNFSIAYSLLYDRDNYKRLIFDKILKIVE